jgi:RNA polymerase sigma-70 factor, ECF subfamily
MARDDENTPGGGVEGRADPDADILDLVGRGQREAALRLLMQRHGRAVYRFCRQQLHTKATADDVHQKVFIEAHRDLPGFGRRSKLKTWLFAIANNRVRDALRVVKRETARIEDDDGTDVADPTPTPADRLDDARLRAALAECVGELDEPIRNAVLLRFQQGFSFEEMSEICEEKPGTLQARVARAMKTLHNCIVKRTGGSP